MTYDGSKIPGIENGWITAGATKFLFQTDAEAMMNRADTHVANSQIRCEHT